MFVGGPVVYNLFYWPGLLCYLWKWHSVQFGTYIFIQAFNSFFPIASLTNITIIALERVHATFCPLRHRVLKIWVYRFIIVIVWVISGLLAIIFSLLEELFGGAVFVTFFSIFPLIICVACTSIVIKVRCGAQPQHHGAASRERKLTMTLLIVTVVSLLLYLPLVIWHSALYFRKNGMLWPLSSSVVYHLNTALIFLFYANSLVNPLLYAIRMPGYRSAVLGLFRRRSRRQRELLPLRNM